MTPSTETAAPSPGAAGRFGRAVLAAAMLTAAFAGILRLAPAFGTPILVDIGPSTGRYGSGFEDSEETPPTTSRWTRGIAAFDVPLDVNASPVRFSVRAARYLDEPTRVTIATGGRGFASFEQARGRQRIQSVEAPLPEGPLDLAFTSDDPKLGMALDWFRIDGADWKIPMREWTVWILPAGLLAALLVSGASMGFACASVSVVLIILAATAAADPFGFVHAMRDVATPTVAVGLIVAVLFRGRSSVTLAVVATLLVKGGMLFHPSYFYNDVRQNDRYVGALKSYEGSLMERSRQAQVDLGVGYPRIVAGKKYAFPYSPVFYVPFTWLPADRDIVVRAIKHVALFTTAAEVVIAFVLARLVMPSIAGLAAWLTFAFPILTSRMLYAMWSTLAGHALDLVVILAAAHLLAKPEDRKRAVWLCLAALATFLTYVSSLFNASAFLVVLALIAANVRWRVAAAWLAAACAIVFGLYGEFTMTFVREIIPAVIQGSSAGAGTPSANESFTFLGAFTRIAVFAGYGFPFFAAAGLIVLWPRRDAPATALKAYALAFLLLVSLRGLSFGLLKDLKEVEFAGPAFAILSALALGRIESRAARTIVAASLIGTGLWMQFGYFERWSRLVLG